MIKPIFDYDTKIRADRPEEQKKSNRIILCSDRQNPLDLCPPQHFCTVTKERAENSQLPEFVYLCTH